MRRISMLLGSGAALVSSMACGPIPPTHSGVGGAGGSGGSAGDAAAPDAAVQAPPPECVAPCLWEAMQYCPAAPAHCIHDKQEFRDIFCDPGNLWSQVRSSASHVSIYTVRRNGTTCFTASSDGYFPILHYYGVGAMPGDVAPEIGSGIPKPDGSVIVGCGVVSYGPVPAPDGGTERGFPDAKQIYRVDPSLPQCAPYRNRVVPYQCESESPGACSD